MHSAHKPALKLSGFSLLSTELIHIGGLKTTRFCTRFLDIFRKHPKILLERTPTSKYSDDGENDSDIKISSLSNAYEQMYWPSVDFSKLCTAEHMHKENNRNVRGEKINCQFNGFRNEFTYLWFFSNLPLQMMQSLCHIWIARPLNHCECSSR